MSYHQWCNKGTSKEKLYDEFGLIKSIVCFLYGSNVFYKWVKTNVFYKWVKTNVYYKLRIT